MPSLPNAPVPDFTPEAPPEDGSEPKPDSTLLKLDAGSS